MLNSGDEKEVWKTDLMQDPWSDLTYILLSGFVDAVSLRSFAH